MKSNQEKIDALCKGRSESVRKAAQAVQTAAEAAEAAIEYRELLKDQVAAEFKVALKEFMKAHGAEFKRDEESGCLPEARITIPSLFGTVSYADACIHLIVENPS